MISDIISDDMNIIADDLNSAIDAVNAELRRQNGNASFVRGLHTVPLEFIVDAVMAVEELPHLLAAANFDAADARAMLDFVDAFRPVVEKMLALATDLTFTMNAWKADAGAGALRVYSILKVLAGDPAAAAHAEKMRHDLGRAGRPRTPRAKAPRPRPFVPRPFED
jgi:hypothetical protein